MYWSDTSIWSERRIPTADDSVIVPSGKAVVLNRPATLSSLKIQGTLSVKDSKGITLTSDWILVNDGIFQAGSEGNPYKNNFIVTISGQDPKDKNEDNSFFKVQGAKGQLHLHGSSR